MNNDNDPEAPLVPYNADPQDAVQESLNEYSARQKYVKRQRRRFQKISLFSEGLLKYKVSHGTGTKEKVEKKVPIFRAEPTDHPLLQSAIERRDAYLEMKDLIPQLLEKVMNCKEHIEPLEFISLMKITHGYYQIRDRAIRGMEADLAAFATLVERDGSRGIDLVKHAMSEVARVRHQKNMHIQQKDMLIERAKMEIKQRKSAKDLSSEEIEREIASIEAQIASGDDKDDGLDEVEATVTDSTDQDAHEAE